MTLSTQMRLCLSALWRSHLPLIPSLGFGWTVGDRAFGQSTVTALRNRGVIRMSSRGFVLAGVGVPRFGRNA